MFQRNVFGSRNFIGRSFAVAAVFAVAWSAAPLEAASAGRNVDVPDHAAPDSPRSSSGLSSPQAAPADFRGGGYVKNFSAACKDAGWTGKYYISVRYLPPNVGGNTGETRFSFFFPLFYAENYILASGDLDSSYQDVAGAGLSSTAFDFTNTPKMRVLEMSPGTIVGSTDHVDMRGQIKGWADVPGCRVTFEISLTRKP